MTNYHLKGNLLRLSLICCLSLIVTEFSLAQGDFTRGKKYKIDSIIVKGSKSYRPQTVISYSGLRIGQVISLPGEKITEVVKKLWRLKLFSNVNIHISNIRGDNAHLIIDIKELPTLIDYKVLGVKKKLRESIEKDIGLKKGLKVNQNFVTTTKQFILKKIREKGFFSAKVNINIQNDQTDENKIRMVIRIDKGTRVKISKIDILNNKKLPDGFIRGAMKKTKQKFFFRLKRSKYVKKNYQEDLVSIINRYKTLGYRDARILRDTIIKGEKDIQLKIELQEGEKYYFGDINFIGNSAYSDRQLSQVLRIQKGDVYNGLLLKKRIADNTKPDGDNITNLYQNNGYLFSSIKPVETSIKNDTIDFDIRIIEGKQAYFNRVTVKGNDRTNDHVIYRELRTRPGELYAKANVVRSVRELSQLRLFDPERTSPDFKNANPNEGVIDLEYNLVEKGASQIQLQGGYGGGGFIGTLGLGFNNFAIKDIFKRKAYRPVPLGDGQNFSLRLQASQFFQTYSISFTEPWLGGKSPVNFSVSLSHTLSYATSRNSLSNFSRNFFQPLSADRSRRFNITGITIGLAKRLKVPDDYFVLSQALSFRYYDLKNYATSLFKFPNGYSTSLSYTVALSRNSSGPNPIYPLGGSNFSISLELTPPYSLFSRVDYSRLQEEERYKLKDSQGFYLDANKNRVSDYRNAIADDAKVDQERFRLLEFYKIKFRGDWFISLMGKLVLRAGAEFGTLGAYNNDLGIVPFNRFFVGGTGLNFNSIEGQENIQIRGYPNRSLSPPDGSAIYNKMVTELRYPIALKPAASIYALAFAEAGKAFDNFSDITPFQLKRSAGLGIRIFMPAFGLIGVDFGKGFDPIGDMGSPIRGWQTHFIIGQQF